MTIEAIDQGKVGDEVYREVLKETRALKGKGCDGWDHRMGEHLVYLTYHTARDIFLDMGREAQLPIILGEECNGVQMATMASLEWTAGSSD